MESTIVDCTGPAPRLLRPGAVGVEEIEAITGLDVQSADASVRAPGTLAAHYAPSAQVVLAASADVAAAVAAASAPVALLAPADVATPEGVVRLASPADSAEYARALYAALREADARAVRTVVAVAPADGALGDAVLDRLRRAAVGSAR